MCARPFFLCGGDSEDLIQEAMFGLIKAIRGFDPERATSFHTFAKACICNRIRSAVTSASRKKHSPLNDSVPIDTLCYPSSSLEETYIDREEGEERLTELKRHLSRLEGQILALYLQGLSYEEIGHEIEKPVKSVDNAVQRIRRKLADSVGVISES
jgi:RNA polymerase sporulation-specific sigma factor